MRWANKKLFRVDGTHVSSATQFFRMGTSPRLVDGLARATLEGLPRATLEGLASATLEGLASATLEV